MAQSSPWTVAPDAPATSAPAPASQWSTDAPATSVAPLDRQNPLRQQWYSQLPNMLDEVKAGWADTLKGLDDSIKKGILAKGVSGLEVVGGLSRIAFAPFTAEVKTWLGDPVERITGIKHASDITTNVAMLFTPSTRLLGFLSEEFRQTQFAQDVMRALSPTSRGVLATRGERSLRAMTAQIAHDIVTTDSEIGRFDRIVGRLSEDAQLEMWHAIETGNVETLAPELQAAAASMRKLLDQRWGRLNSVGRLDNYIENYVPRIYEKPELAAQAKDQAQAAELAAAGKRPLRGSESFRKRRVFPTLRDAMAWTGPNGEKLRPVTTNPLRMTMIGLASMDHAYYGQLFIEDLKADSILHWVPDGATPLPGHIKVDDPAFRILKRPEEGEPFGTRHIGDWYAPEQVATLINNYLSEGSTGDWARLFANPNMNLGLVLRVGGNLLNTTTLGFSGFHLAFTTADAMASRMAVGMMQLMNDADPRGLWKIATSPVGFATGLWKGYGLSAAYRNPLGAPPSTEMARVLDMLIQGGGRATIDEMHKIIAGKPIFQRLANGTYFHDLAKDLKSNPLKAVFNTAGDLLKLPFSAVNDVVLGWWVPRQKLGVFYDLAANWLRANPGATPIERQMAAIKFWDSTENRMGLMTYDNIFWNKTAKNVAFLSVRAVGWNLGTWRELGGAVVDTYGNLKNLSRGEWDALELTPRMAYTVAMTATTAIIGSIATYLYTGKGPTELIDYFYPPTGRLTATGAKERVSIPGYMKDVFAFKHDPSQTLGNKLNPMLAYLFALWSNRDFYGAMIHDWNDPAGKQLGDVWRWSKNYAQPFSVQSIRQLEKVGPLKMSEVFASLFGFQRAPGYIVDPQLAAAQQARADAPARRRKAKEEAGLLGPGAAPPTPTSPWSVAP